MRKIAYTACWLHCGASAARRRPTDAIAAERIHHNAPALRSWQRVTDVIQSTYDDLKAQGEIQHLFLSEVGKSTRVYQQNHPSNIAIPLEASELHSQGTALDGGLHASNRSKTSKKWPTALPFSPAAA